MVTQPLSTGSPNSPAQEISFHVLILACWYARLILPVKMRSNNSSTEDFVHSTDTEIILINTTPAIPNAPQL